MTKMNNNNPASPFIGEGDGGGLQQTSLLYRQACNQYLATFCKKHGYSLRDADWIGLGPGDCAQIGDYTVDMRTIIDDLEMDAPEEEFVRWYDYCLEAYDLGVTAPNYRSWLRGCPRIPEERLAHLRELRAALHREIDELKREY